MSKLITIEGIDGAGKETQSKLLYQRLQAENIAVKLVSFPAYDSDSSALVKMYLAGKFGHNANDVSAYQASVLFAIDRFASFKTNWQEFYQQGGIVIADRYTTANMIHQGGKIADLVERKAFLDWLDEFEYNLMALPRPDLTLFLDVDPETSRRLTAERQNKSDASIAKDIHEKDNTHLTQSYLAAKQLAKTYDWRVIDCLSDGKLKSIEQIASEIWTQVKQALSS